MTAPLMRTLAATRNAQARSAFQRVISERRAYPVGSPDHSYRTRAAALDLHGEFATLNYPLLRRPTT